jgi:hypothetical protein
MFLGVGCKKDTECRTTVELVRKCRFNHALSNPDELEKQVGMCEEAKRTWPDVQDELDCALAADGDCKVYRECERGVQRQRLIDEAVRQQGNGMWKPTKGWCSIFKEHHRRHPDVVDLCAELEHARPIAPTKSQPERKASTPTLP